MSELCASVQSRQAGVAGDGFAEVGHCRQEGDRFWNKRDKPASSLQLQIRTPGWVGGCHSTLELSAVFWRTCFSNPVGWKTEPMQG